MRLIDADELRKNMFDYAPPEMEWDRGDIEHKIGEMPTIDAVLVVRCKDCKHSEHWYSDKCLCHLWSETGIDVFEDGYCSYGKRSEKDDSN